jgi:ABC-type antimicrobial peptide transport system permease subunit
MLSSFLKIALRNLRRNFSYSFINIAGLSIGIACSILILLWVYDELTYNQNFTGYENLYHVKLNNKTDKGIVTGHFTPMPLREVILQQDSRIKRYAMTIPQGALLSIGEKKINKSGIDATESFLTMFDFKMISGDAATALTDPRSIVLTRATATALFGDEDPIGKMVQVKVGSLEEMKVTGVLEDLPTNISFRFDFIMPFAFFEQTSDWVQHARNNWINRAFEMYVELQPGTDKSAVDNSIHDLISKHSTDAKNYELFLHGMSRWRLHNNFENGKESGGLITYVTLFTGIALFILVIACINFMNLATARSQHRAREVGVRKIVGSNRYQLIFQFIGESLVISSIAFILSVVLVELVLPFYNNLISKKLIVDYTSGLFWAFAVCLIFVTGILAGSYPAFYLSSFRPAKMLKGKTSAGGSGTPRQLLVTLQVGFSILLMTGTVVIYQQIQYLKNREPGYNRENLMLIWSSSDIEKNYHALKQELEATPAVESVTKSNSPITRLGATSPLEGWTGMQAGQHVEVTNIATEYDYTRTMGIRMVQGRDFSPDFKSDTTAIILNLAAVKALGLTNPVGDKVKMWGQEWLIIGVMDDVLMGSGSSYIDPSAMTMDPTWSNTISVRLAKTSDLQASVRAAEDIFKKYNPDYPF